MSANPAWAVMSQGRVCVDRSMLVCVVLPQSHIEELVKNIRGRKYVSCPTGFITCSMTSNLIAVILIQAAAAWPQQRHIMHSETRRLNTSCGWGLKAQIACCWCYVHTAWLQMNHDFLSNPYLNAPCSPLRCMFVQCVNSFFVMIKAPKPQQHLAVECQYSTQLHSAQGTNFSKMSEYKCIFGRRKLWKCV